MNSTSLAVQNGSGAMSLVPRSYPEAIAFATDVMANSGLVPTHLQKKPADCFLILMQAVEWGMNPLAVAQKTSVINGRLMYEGQLVSAIINTRLDLEEDLDYQFSGEGNKRVLKVVGKRKGWSKARDIELTFEQACAINRNGAMQKQPDQQMCYIGARIWCRRFASNVLLGIYAKDEPFEEDPIDVTATAAGAGAPLTGGATTEEAPTKRPPVPRKSKGAAAIVQPATPAPAATPTEVQVAQEQPLAEPPPPLPTEEPKPTATEPLPPGEPKAWPQVVKARIIESVDTPVKNNPKYTSVKGVRLAEGTIVLNGVDSDVALLGRVYFDPEVSEIQKFAVVGDDMVELTIDERPSVSNPQKKNRLVIKASLADVAM